MGLQAAIASSAFSLVPPPTHRDDEDGGCGEVGLDFRTVPVMSMAGLPRRILGAGAGFGRRSESEPQAHLIVSWAAPPGPNHRAASTLGR